MKDKKRPKAAAGDIIEITARLVSDKVQPHFSVGSRFTVIHHTDGGKVIVKHPTRPKATLMISADRFEWRIITPEMLDEELLRRECADNVQKVSQALTPQEQIRLAIVPLIVNHIVWTYALKACDLSAKYRVQILKKLTRTVRELRKEYVWTLEKDLDCPFIWDMEKQTEQFMAECNYDFTVFYYSVNNEFKRTMPTCPYDDLRTNALLAVIIIRWLDEYTKKTDAMAQKKIGSYSASVRQPTMTALLTCMEAMAGEVGKFDYNAQDIVNCQNILRNNINRIEFNINE